MRIHKEPSSFIDLISQPLHFAFIYLYMDGLTASGFILEQNPNIKIWALSADVTEENQRAIDALGMQGLIMKPYKPTDIKKALSSIEE